MAYGRRGFRLLRVQPRRTPRGFGRLAFRKSSFRRSGGVQTSARGTRSLFRRGYQVTNSLVAGRFASRGATRRGAELKYFESWTFQNSEVILDKSCVPLRPVDVVGPPAIVYKDVQVVGLLPLLKNDLTSGIMSGIQQNSTASGRIGRRILLKLLDIRWSCMTDETEDSHTYNTGPISYDVIVVHDRQCNGQVPGDADTTTVTVAANQGFNHHPLTAAGLTPATKSFDLIFSGVTPNRWLRQQDVSQNARFKILARKTYHLVPASASVLDAAKSFTPRSNHAKRLMLRLNMPIEYDQVGSGGLLAELRTNNILVFWVFNARIGVENEKWPVAVEVQASSYLRYSDM